MNREGQRECTVDTRRYPRYALETDLSATAPGQTPEKVRGCSLNINEAGLAALFATEWEVGTSVQLQFSVPFTTAPVRLKAVVRNRTSYRYGFEFVNLTTEHRGAISRTCRMLGLFQ